MIGERYEQSIWSVLRVDDTPSPSGHGWTLDGMYPFFPGTPCLQCGRFVGRDGYFGVDTFEMSSRIASVEAECRRCLDPTPAPEIRARLTEETT